MSNFNLRAIISATDRLSPVLRAQSRQLASWRRSFESAGKGALPITIGLSSALMMTSKAFMETESASKNL